MRFVLLVIGAAATGALSVTGVRTMTTGGLNPLNAGYDPVAQQTALRRAVDAPAQQVVTVGPSSFDTGPVLYLDGGPVQRTWEWDIRRRTHYDMAPARNFVHHGAPYARESHPVAHPDVRHVRESPPIVHHATPAHMGRVSHGGGHGRR